MEKKENAVNGTTSNVSLILKGFHLKGAQLVLRKIVGPPTRAIAESGAGEATKVVREERVMSLLQHAVREEEFSFLSEHCACIGGGKKFLDENRDLPSGYAESKESAMELASDIVKEMLANREPIAVVSQSGLDVLEELVRSQIRMSLTKKYKLDLVDGASLLTEAQDRYEEAGKRAKLPRKTFSLQRRKADLQIAVHAQTTSQQN